MTELQKRVLMQLYLCKTYMTVAQLCEFEGGVGVPYMRTALAGLLEHDYITSYDDLWRIAHRGRALFDHIGE